MPGTPTPARRFRKPTVVERVKLAFMAAGFVSFLLSVSLWFIGDNREAAIFVGLWVPAIHSLGTLVLAGSRDRA